MTTDPRQVRDSLGRQSFLRLLGAEATVVEPGHVVLELPFRDDLCQQNGFLHAGVLTSVADSACGYAALTLMPAGSDVLSVEFKVNLLSPGRGERFRADARVVRSGRTLTRLPGRRVRPSRRASRTSPLRLMQATMIARRRAATHAGLTTKASPTRVREYVPEVARARPGLGTETLQQLTDLQRQVSERVAPLRDPGAAAQPAARPARRGPAPPPLLVPLALAARDRTRRRRQPRLAR